MALEENNGNGMIMPVQPMGYGYGGNYGGGFGGFGNGFGFGGDISWILILFLFGMFGGWGGMGGFGGFGGMWGMEGMFPWLLASNANNQNATQDGFNQAATATTLSGIQSAITSGFGDTQLGIAGINQNICQSTGQIQNSMCQGFNGVTAAVTGAQNALAQQMYNNQIADLERSYNAQTASTAGMNNIAMNLQNCCCENRAATADLKYTVATEACADRAAVGDALQNVTMQNMGNTNAIVGAIRDGIQSIKDDMCADRLEAERRENQNLRTQLNMANLAASRTAQTAQLLADNARQTQDVENYIRPQINPAYIVPNPYACYYGNNTGCGCNGSNF